MTTLYNNIDVKFFNKTLLEDFVYLWMSNQESSYVIDASSVDISPEDLSNLVEIPQLKTIFVNKLTRTDYIVSDWCNNDDPDIAQKVQLLIKNK